MVVFRASKSNGSHLAAGTMDCNIYCLKCYWLLLQGAQRTAMVLVARRTAAKVFWSPKKPQSPQTVMPNRLRLLPAALLPRQEDPRPLRLRQEVNLALKVTTVTSCCNNCFGCKTLVLTLICPYSEVPLQSDCSDWLPKCIVLTSRMSLHQLSFHREVTIVFCSSHPGSGAR